MIHHLTCTQTFLDFIVLKSTAPCTNVVIRTKAASKLLTPISPFYLTSLSITFRADVTILHFDFIFLHT